jgi:hypothetical protein
MSKLHVAQIAGYLERNLQDKIDLTDCKSHKNPEDVKKIFLTRALAALSASHLTSKPIEDFIGKITDGSGDGGIDLIYFNDHEKILYLVQTKWHEDGNGSISQGDVLKFISGVRKIIDLNISDFNARVKSCEADIKNAVYDANAKIALVVAHTGSHDLNEVVHNELIGYIEQQNDTSEIMFLEVLNQSILHRAVSAGLGGNPIDIEVQLQNWGQLREPHKAIYGRVFAADIANWYGINGPRLFEKNLRQFLPSSSVNQDLVETIQNRPDEFWYFNNGITAISRSLEKKLLGGNQTDTGIWECKGFSVVNGAQTVGSIHAAFTANPEVAGNATVSVRIIEISEEDDAFGLEVTRNTNTQNSVEKRDFVALDPEQERIRQELRFEGVDYHYKSGSSKGDLEKSFDLTEATIALACSYHDVSLAVQAKREISRLWDDIQRPPYRILFNAGTSGPQVWQLVKILREVERQMSLDVSRLDGRDRLIGVHGNRFIQWVAFNRIGVGRETMYSDIRDNISTSTSSCLSEVILEVQKVYADSYPAALFKNSAKCKEIAARLRR